MRPVRIALALAVASLPAAPLALEWVARAGVDYWRQDVRTGGEKTTNTPRLDLNLALDLRGFVIQPEVAAWSAGVAYRRLESSYGGAPASVAAGLEYRLETTLFGSRASPFTVTAGAALTTADVGVGAGPSGTLETSTYGASANLRLEDRPRVGFGYDRHSSRQSNPILGVSTVDRDRFNATIAHGTPVYAFSADYTGVLSTGTFAGDNSDEHRARISAAVNLDRNVRLRITDSFYRRTPTLEAAVNPRLELNRFDLRIMDLRDRDPRDLASRTYQEATYSYASGVSDAPGRPLSSRATQRASYSTEHHFDPKAWSIRGTVAATYSEGRIGPLLDRSAGQTLGATVYWRRSRLGAFTELSAGPTLGVLERLDGIAHLGYGGAAAASVQRALPTGNVRGTYSLDFASNTGEPGWSLGQQLSIGADRPIWAGTLRGQLLASARRAESPLFGTSASRSVAGIADWATRRLLVELRAGLDEGLSGGLRDPGAGDALFIAPAYDSHTRHVGVRASVAVIRELRLIGSGRVTSTDLPDRPALSEMEWRAGISYAYGGFGLSLEDQYVISRGESLERRVNQVVFQVYRVIGGGQGYVLR